MPYRPGIIVSGEDFVNETAGLNRRMRERLKSVPVMATYEDEDALLDHARRVRAEDEAAKQHARERMEYLTFWGREKFRELRDCLQNGHDLCEQCGCCIKTRYDHHNRFRCLCNEGKRMLSPYRIVWLNSAAREHWRTWIWQVGSGYVPRSKPQAFSPKSEELSW